MTYIGILLVVIAEFKYMYSVVKGKSKPNFSAWGIFTISMILVLLSSYALGAKDSLIHYCNVHLITSNHNSPCFSV